MNTECMNIKNTECNRKCLRSFRMFCTLFFISFSNICFCRVLRVGYISERRAPEGMPKGPPKSCVLYKNMKSKMMLDNTIS